jgi:hypothetical protein
MDSLRVRWGTDIITINDEFALKSIARASESFDEGRSSPLPFELTPGLFSVDEDSSQPFARIAPVPVQFCDATHRVLYDLMGLEFPAALRLRSTSSGTEDLLAIRAWLRQPDSADTTARQVVIEGYLLSDKHEPGHRYQAALTDDVAEVLYRSIDGSFNRIRPRVSAGWRAVSREVGWPLSGDGQEKAAKPRVYKKAELEFSSIAPKLLHQALSMVHARGSGSARELSLALGVPEKQAAGFWKGLIADRIFEKSPAGNWALNERSQHDIEKRKPPRLKRKEASALIDQLVRNAEAINRLPEGESSLYITALQVLGNYLDINLDDFQYLYVVWHCEMRRTEKWPYVPDLANPETGFEAIKAMLRPGDKRLRLLDDVEVGELDCPQLSFFKFKPPAAPQPAPQSVNEPQEATSR